MANLDETMMGIYNERVANAPAEVRPAKIGEEKMCKNEHIEKHATLGDFKWACTKAKGHPDTLHVAHSSLGGVCHRWVEESGST